MALDIVKKFEGRKIIITPGMVELGAKEKELKNAVSFEEILKREGLTVDDL